MPIEKQESSARRLSFMGPLLLFVLLFTLCCGVLACIFVRASAISRTADAYNAAVGLCRSQAECIRAGQLPEEQTRYFDAALQPCAPEAAVYRVDFQTTYEAAAGGSLCTVTVAAGPAQGEALYQLEAAVYLPQEE